MKEYVESFLQTPAMMRSVCSWEWLDDNKIKIYLGYWAGANDYTLSCFLDRYFVDVGLKFEVTEFNLGDRKKQGNVILKFSK